MGKTRPRKKGYRQAHLKRFHGEYINAGKKANSAYLQEAFDRTRSMAKGIPLPVSRDVRRADYASNREHFKQSEVLQDTSDVVLRKLKELWQGDFWQGQTAWKRINLILTGTRNLFLLFADERFFFVAEYPLLKSVKRSIIYPSRHIAMMHMETGTICWIQPKDLSFPLLDGLPSRPG
jgi:hypothetical protein